MEASGSDRRSWQSGAERTLLPRFLSGKTLKSSRRSGAIVFSVSVSSIVEREGAGGAAASMAAIFFLLFCLLDSRSLLLHLHTELVGGTAEFAHQLAKLARELRQLLRTEEDQEQE